MARVGRSIYGWEKCVVELISILLIGCECHVMIADILNRSDLEHQNNVFTITNGRDRNLARTF